MNDAVVTSEGWIQIDLLTIKKRLVSTKSRTLLMAMNGDSLIII